MTNKLKIVLRDSDGAADIAQGVVEAEKYSALNMLSHDGKFYLAQSFRYEHGTLVRFYNEVSAPVEITEF